MTASWGRRRFREVFKQIAGIGTSDLTAESVMPVAADVRREHSEMGAATRWPRVRS